jgi:ribonucleotide monophosphatase NagD (HAD superfamily)
MIEPTFCSGLADIASRYGGFIVDQWGVLHDGARPYPDRSSAWRGCARRASGSCC